MSADHVAPSHIITLAGLACCVWIVLQQEYTPRLIPLQLCQISIGLWIRFPSLRIRQVRRERTGRPPRGRRRNAAGKILLVIGWGIRSYGSGVVIWGSLVYLEWPIFLGEKSREWWEGDAGLRVIGVRRMGCWIWQMSSIRQRRWVRLISVDAIGSRTVNRGNGHTPDR